MDILVEQSNGITSHVETQSIEEFIDIDYENYKKIQKLKQELNKYKEDLEQVESFGLIRLDYEEKKKRCAELVNEIRVLEGKEPWPVNIKENADIQINIEDENNN